MKEPLLDDPEGCLEPKPAGAIHTSFERDFIMLRSLLTRNFVICVRGEGYGFD
jgi:hypothetical protein